MKKYLVSLIIKEMQIKTTKSFSLTLVRIAIAALKRLKITSASKDVEKRKTYCSGECKLAWPL